MINLQEYLSDASYLSILNSLKVGVVSHLPDTSILYSNGAASDILGLSEDQMKGLTAVDPSWHFIHTNLAPMALENYPVNQVKATGVALKNYEFGVIHPDREDVTWLTLNALPLFDEDKELTQIIVNFVDITSQREATIFAEKLLAKQKDMFAIVAHELRTPVASITMIVDDISITDDKKIESIRELSNNLLNILDDMRVVVQPERTLHITHTLDDPAKVVTRAVSPLSHVFINNKIDLHLSITPQAMNSVFHAQALRQLTFNLTNNAAIHSGGNNIWVSLSYDFSDNTKVKATLKVEDDGKGIPEDRLGHLFEAFTRGDTSAEGSGLGLFIANNLASSLGGSLIYRLGERGGSLFETRFDIIPSLSEVKNSSPEESTNQLDGMRILFAEDDQMIQMLTAKLLSNQGALVDAFLNGRLALDAYQSNTYDLVITDLMMPEMNGTQFIEQLRKLGCELPIIAVTAAVLGEESDHLMSVGANAVLPKPISSLALNQTLINLGV